MSLFRSWLEKNPAELQRQLHSEHPTDMGGYSSEPMDPLDSPYCREQGNICASSTTHTELPETQQEVRETQHYSVVPEAEATRGGTHRKCLFYKFWDFRHWNFHILGIGICCSGKWRIHPWESSKDMDVALGDIVQWWTQPCWVNCWTRW